MFKEPETVLKDVNIERSEELCIESPLDIIAVEKCPFCMTMMTDGGEEQKQGQEVKC